MSSPMRITVDIPEPLSNRSAAELEVRARLLLMIDEVRAGRLTRSAAASALGMSLEEFLVQSGAHGLNAIDYDEEELERELESLPRQRT